MAVPLFRTNTLWHGLLGQNFLRYLFGLERLNHVALLDVVVVFESDAAFLARAHLGGLILEAPQGGHLTGVHHDVVAQ